MVLSFIQRHQVNLEIMDLMRIYPCPAGQKSKNIELIKNYALWFELNYEIVYFYNVYGPGHIKNR